MYKITGKQWLNSCGCTSNYAVELQQYQYCFAVLQKLQKSDLTACTESAVLTLGRQIMFVHYQLLCSLQCLKECSCLIRLLLQPTKTCLWSLWPGLSTWPSPTATCRVIFVHLVSNVFVHVTHDSAQMLPSVTRPFSMILCTGLGTRLSFPLFLGSLREATKIIPHMDYTMQSM